MSIHQLGVPGEALVQGREMGFRNGSHWRNNYIIIEPKIKTVGKRDMTGRRGRELLNGEKARGTE